MKKAICILTLIVLVLFVGGCFNKNTSKTAILQIIEEDITNNKTRVYEKYVVLEDSFVVLGDKEIADCNRKPNDISIGKIEDDYVTISRDKIGYDEETGEMYTEFVLESIVYNEKFSISINETDPNGPVCSESKYYYYLMFVKN